MMEVFAGFVTHTDHHYGRLFEFLKQIGEWDNTLVRFISDNGASAEGGPTGSVNENKFCNNVPDSLEENLAKLDELGGVSDPFLVHWPKGIKAKGQVWTQYAHAIDMVPTVLEALGIEAPTRELGQDPTETRNLAEKERAKLIELIGMWYVEAGKYGVLPIDSRGTLRLADERPQIAIARKSYTL
jgi:arylsulfatase